MTKRSILAVVLGLWMVWTAAGCGRSGFLSDGAPDWPSLTRAISDSGMRAALEKLGYKSLTVEASDDEVEMTVRRIGDHRTPFSDEEIAEIRQTAYDLVGYRFPLAVAGWVLGEKPQMTGRVTAVDGNRVLVVDEAKKLGETQQPDDKRVNVIRFTQYIEGDHLVSVDSWKKGDRVEIWDIGYPVDSNAIAATRIERIS